MGNQNLKPNRRQVLTISGGSAAALLLAATPGLAADGGLRGPMRALAGKVFYTTEQPGRWKGKAGGHAPLIKEDKDGNDVLIRSATNHPMSRTHHIVKHILLDGELNFVKEQVFDIDFDMPAPALNCRATGGGFSLFPCVTCTTTGSTTRTWPRCRMPVLKL